MEIISKYSACEIRMIIAEQFGLEELLNCGVTFVQLTLIKLLYFRGCEVLQRSRTSQLFFIACASAMLCEGVDLSGVRICLSVYVSALKLKKTSD